MMKLAYMPVLGTSITLLLAACGGRSDDVPAQAAPRAAISAMPARDAAEAMPATATPLAGTTLADDVAQLKQAVAQLRREVADIRQQQARMPSAAHVAKAATPDLRRDPSAREEAETAERLRIASAESAFRDEQQDARWSSGTSASVRAALAEGDGSLRDQVRSVECRSQTCRVEIGADASGVLERDLPMVIGRLGATLPNVTAGQINQGDGRQATVLYFSAH